MSKIILITGASSGFGKAIAEKFAAGGWNLILTARRKEKLAEVATAIEKKYGVKTLSLVFDVQDKEAVFAQLNDLPAAPRRGGVAFAIQASQLFYATGLDSAGTRTNQSWLYNLPISITENALDKTVKIYPNPCADFLNINLENLPKNALLSVYSVDGKFLFSQVLTEKNTKLKVQALAAGNYFLRIELGNTTLIKSFSKH